ncbi:hypothetical protein G6F65_023043 [Rhizopus arrhizus]|nr:hypothetical protein G6F65_023043 [Rhizopus arrhizus]
MILGLTGRTRVRRIALAHHDAPPAAQRGASGADHGGAGILGPGALRSRAVVSRHRRGSQHEFLWLHDQWRPAGDVARSHDLVEPDDRFHFHAGAGAGGQPVR